MIVLIDLNRYLHDFTSALWVCGSILIWLMARETRSSNASQETTSTLNRLIGRIRMLTVPSLIITLCSGGVRAITFAEYEHVGEITTGVIVSLIIKHIAFAVFVAWGIWIHWKTWSGVQQTGETA